MDSVLFSAAALLGAVVGLVALGVGVYMARRGVARAREQARLILGEARQEAEARAQEILVSTQEKSLAAEQESDRRERDLEIREGSIETRARQIEQDGQAHERRGRELDRQRESLTRAEDALRSTQAELETQRAEALRTLERVAGLTAEQARTELIEGIEAEVRKESVQLARRIEDEAREGAERLALNLIVQATQRVNIREAVETTVSYIELPNDELKGRIIGREGRNIRALEMATGIDLIVDDTPRAIVISSFDPVRREIARMAIDRLVEDGRIHPARIEEVVSRVGSEIEAVIEETGTEAAFRLGLSDLQPRLVKLVGRLKFQTSRGQNLLQHCTEVALIAGYMAGEIGARVEVAQRAGLLHEIGRVDDLPKGHIALASAELAGKGGEGDGVVHAIQSLHPEVEAKTLEALLLQTANRVSENRPGARKENLEIFIERLRRLESIAASFPGVAHAYAVKAGKELRVIVDAKAVTDADAYRLSKEIARTLEREVTYQGQIKVTLVRETRAVQFAV